MSAISMRRSAAGLLLLVLILTAGCSSEAAAPGPAETTVPAGSVGPGVIELSDAIVTFVEPNRVRFEVRYRFTQGRPDRFYLCELTFPGTPFHGAKPMESWELKPEGVIKDGFVLTTPPGQTFELRVSEAESPDRGYKLISNVLQGAVK